MSSLRPDQTPKEEGHKFWAPKKQAISDKMTNEKMNADKRQTVCKFYNSGYCKFKGDCKNTHPKLNCALIECKNKRCCKRHPKKCRYGDNCRRKSSCLYKHDLSSTPLPNKMVESSEVVKLKLEVEKLKEENKQKLHDIKVLADEENGLKAQVKSLEATISKLMGENKVIEKELKANLKKVTEESKGKDKTISELKENLKQKEDKNKQQNMKLIKTEQESVRKDNKIKLIKQNVQTTKDMDAKGKGSCCTKRVNEFIETLIPCEFCESLWQNENDLKTHEPMCRDLTYGSDP